MPAVLLQFHDLSVGHWHKPDEAGNIVGIVAMRLGSGGPEWFDPVRTFDVTESPWLGLVCSVVLVGRQREVPPNPDSTKVGLCDVSRKAVSLFCLFVWSPCLADG